MAERLDRIARAAAENQQDRGVEVRRDASVERELGRGGDVGEVAAHDEHRVALRLHGPVGGHDAGHGRRRVVVCVFVGDADALLIGQARARPCQQQFKHPVALPAPTNERSEDPHPGGVGEECVQ